MTDPTANEQRANAAADDLEVEVEDIADLDLVDGDAEAIRAGRSGIIGGNGAQRGGPQATGC